MKTSSTYTNADLIAIVDSRPMFRKGFSATLSQTRKHTEILEANNCQELGLKIDGHVPNIIFVSGSGFSDIDILAQVDQLRRDNPFAAIVVYDSRDSLDFLFIFFQDGNGGYLPEDFDELDLEMCIKSLSQGLHYVNSEIAYQLITQKRIKQRKVLRTKMLSDLEKKVAACLIKGMSTSEIASMLDRRSSTISTVKSNIYRKANVHNVIDLAAVLGKK